MLIIVVAIYLPTLGQIQYNKLSIDSLKHLNQIEKLDGKKILILQNLGQKLLYKSHNEALQYVLESKELAEQTNDTIGLIYAFIGLCDIYSLVGEYKMAIDYITQAIRIIPKDNYMLLNFGNSRLATVYSNMGEDSLSLVYDKISLKYSLLNNDSLGVAYDMYKYCI